MNKYQYMEIWQGIVVLIFILVSLIAVSRLINDNSLQYICYAWIGILTVVYYLMMNANVIALNQVRK